MRSAFNGVADESGSPDELTPMRKGVARERGGWREASLTDLTPGLVERLVQGGHSERLGR
jgi:hypothetical protein